MNPQLIEAPASDATHEIAPLAYLKAYDAVLNDDYAFAAYQEIDRSGGAWRVRIRSRHTTGVVMEPALMRTQARAAAAQGKPFFTWGAGIDPSDGDPRHIEYRVHVSNGAPHRVEIFTRLREFGGAAGAAKSVYFAWPA